MIPSTPFRTPVLACVLGLLVAGPGADLTARAATAEAPSGALIRPVSDAAGSRPSSVGERFVYRWELKKLAALLGGIFLPGEGQGLLTFEPRGDDTLLTELLITSEHSDEGEYWRYGAEIDLSEGRATKAWSSYLWRGERDSDSAEIDEAGVIDVASGIYRIRGALPTRPLRLRIWSDGKIYPVVVQFLGDETRTLPGGRRMMARHYRVEGREVPGERHWKGHMDLWFARDGNATPIEIHFDRTLIGVRLRLVPD